MSFTIAVFASTRGTTFGSILDAKQQGDLEGIDIGLLFSNKPDCGAVQKAHDADLPVEILSYTKDMSRREYDQKVFDILDPYNVDLIVLVGYMRLFSPWFVQQFAKKIINVHPALPKYPGMDLDVHAEVLKNKETITGMTIHYVDEGMDTGEVICQKTIEVLPDDTPQTLKKRVQDLEKEWYPKIIKQLASKLPRSISGTPSGKGE